MIDEQKIDKLIKVICQEPDEIKNSTHYYYTSYGKKTIEGLKATIKAILEDE